MVTLPQPYLQHPSAAQHGRSAQLIAALPAAAAVRLGEIWSRELALLRSSRPTSSPSRYTCGVARVVEALGESCCMGCPCAPLPGFLAHRHGCAAQLQGTRTLGKHRVLPFRHCQPSLTPPRHTQPCAHRCKVVHRCAQVQLALVLECIAWEVGAVEDQTPPACRECRGRERTELGAAPGTAVSSRLQSGLGRELCVQWCASQAC